MLEKNTVVNEREKNTEEKQEEMRTAREKKEHKIKMKNKRKVIVPRRAIERPSCSSVRHTHTYLNIVKGQRRRKKRKKRRSRSGRLVGSREKVGNNNSYRVFPLNCRILFGSYT